MPVRMHDDEVDIAESLVRRLVDEQFPQFADRALSIVEPWGTDNAIWRLGDDLVVRLPRMHWAVNQVALEQEWLPQLAPDLPVAVPEPVGVGEPDCGYPHPWAIHKWVRGEGATIERMADPIAFARDLAKVVRALGQLSVEGAPAARNRARPLAEYDAPTRRAIDECDGLIDTSAALTIWEAALAAPPHDGDLVWVHADLEGNCLLLDGQLHGLVDWGSACAGDPAVEVHVVWSPLFNEDSRAVFLEQLQVDDATLARARGAAINQACAALPYYLHTYPLIVERSWHKLAALGVHAR